MSRHVVEVLSSALFGPGAPAGAMLPLFTRGMGEPIPSVGNVPAGMVHTADTERAREDSMRCFGISVEVIGADPEVLWERVMFCMLLVPLAGPAQIVVKAPVSFFDPKRRINLCDLGPCGIPVLRRTAMVGFLSTPTALPPDGWAAGLVKVRLSGEVLTYGDMLAKQPLLSVSKKTITFSAALNTRIEQYAAMHAEMDFNTAVRELVNLGLSAAPTDELMVQARRHAFDKTRHWALSEVAIKFREVADSAEKQLGAYRADEEER